MSECNLGVVTTITTEVRPLAPEKYLSGPKAYVISTCSRVRQLSRRTMRIATGDINRNSTKASRTYALDPHVCYLTLCGLPLLVEEQNRSFSRAGSTKIWRYDITNSYFAIYLEEVYSSTCELQETFHSVQSRSSHDDEPTNFHEGRQAPFVSATHCCQYRHGIMMAIGRPRPHR